jgi:aminoglycoside 6'-N-acetyltransferase
VGLPTLADEALGLRLRPLGETDRPAVAALMSEPTVARWWDTASERPPAEDLFDPDPETSVWAVERRGELVGVLMVSEEANPGYRSAAFDIALGPADQGEGLGPGALRLAIGWLAAERGHHRFTIDPRADNERAISAYRKVGFEPVGVMRAYETDTGGRRHDGLLMDLVITAG